MSNDIKTVLEKLRDQIDAERGVISGIDGYNYNSGEEYGMRRALRLIDKTLTTQPATPAPIGEANAMGGEAVVELCKYWNDFCDADIVPDGFIERMEDAGFAELTEVTDEALDAAFSSERGIEEGGSMWQLTDAGRAALTLPQANATPAKMVSEDDAVEFMARAVYNAKPDYIFKDEAYSFEDRPKHERDNLLDDMRTAYRALLALQGGK